MTKHIVQYYIVQYYMYCILYARYLHSFPIASSEKHSLNIIAVQNSPFEVTSKF
jgi:hypothetical protein